ncbi:efflux RND transporter periplasmic adaptor subunit [Stenomitos frigidus]|uniref:Efflux transporter periplasmic adaptor subunit n=1 Tax=Stenomitos frigidus ULC18 TaxID=2107698 RepID=A0A2T1ENM4_9CYAN|nr:efflux RND transporter periplasmic adaptor subunit [Stenomitos frigidus]PSB34326.1 efflux transporter periplasmic adaptor subunit [Stenomitos frigidus ULC18]
MQLPIVDKVTKTNPWMIGLVVAGMVGITAVTVSLLRTTTPKQPVSELTVPVQLKDTTTRIIANGEVQAVKELNLNPKTAGRLEALMVQRGDRVKQGQIVARMETRELQADRAQAQAEMAKAQANLSLLRAGSRPEAIAQAQASANQAQAQITSAQTRLNLALQRSQRNRALSAEGAISRDKLDEVLNEEQSARANLEQAKAGYNSLAQQLNQQKNGSRIQEVQQAAAQVAAAQATLDKIDVQLEDAVIRAPFNGVITQTGAEVGAFVAPTSFASSTSSATYVANLASDLEVKAKVPEVDISQIRLGQPVEIRAGAYPDRTFKGIVKRISPKAEEEDATQKGVVTFAVWVELGTGKDLLRSGMKDIDLTFLGKQLKQALIVPTVAIVTDKGQTGVLVPDAQNKPKFQLVTVGSTIGNETQILSGIQAGNQVFVELPEGQKLENITKGVNQK